MTSKGMVDRRAFIGMAAAGVLAAQVSSMKPASANGIFQAPARSLGASSQVDAGALDIGYYQSGPDHGIPVLLLHGWPYDVHSYVDVAPLLAERGCRVIVPHLRGHGTTRVREPGANRSGQQAAIGADVIALMDALGIPAAVLAGYDWGGRAACVAAALWPARCAGLVSVNSYLIQDIAKSALPLPPTIEAGLWYQFYFLTDRGHSGLAANRREIARLMWARNSPTWSFDDATFNRSAGSFDNPDYLDIVIHSYRHRLGHADGFAEYAELERRLAAQPVITAPTITLDGDSDGVVPATDGSSSRTRFAGPRQHRILAGVGHNVPQENPSAFADAVWELASAQSMSAPRRT